MLNAVHHIALDSAYYDKTVTFYEALGMTQWKTWGSEEEKNRACMMQFGNGSCIEIFERASVADPAGNYPHLAFAVDDTDACYNAAIAAAATTQIVTTDLDIPCHGGAYPVRIAFVVGFNKEVLEFFAERK